MARSRTYFVETFRPAYPEKGVRVRVHADRDYATDVLHPGMTSVIEVSHVATKDEAIAVALEHAAGIGVAAHRIFPRAS
jgi:hypothetical protein